MAPATTFLCHHLLPISAQSRPKIRNSRNYPLKKLSQIQNPNPNPKTSISTVGSQATTYTRLPPKPDSFIIQPFDFASDEITLSDSIPSIKIPDRDFPIVVSNPQYDTVNGEFQSPSDSDSDYDDEGLGFEDGNPDDFFDGGDFLDEEEEGEEKEKGVPAVMRCFDRAKIYVKAGDGGNGVVAFRREKFVPLGGPSGGDGGRGGNVYVEVDGSMNSLLPFRKNIHFRAGRGNHGQGRKMAGARGEDVVVKVAPGTVIREAEEGALLLELLYPGQRALLLPGGRGGRGNASFKSGTNKVPKIAEKGEEGAEM